MNHLLQLFRISMVPAIIIVATMLFAQPTTAQQPSGIQLPVVTVDDRASAADIDWATAIADAGMNYASRWDNMTLVDSCLWVTPEELSERFGTSMPIRTQIVDFQCRYYAGNTLFLSIWLELHPNVESVREAEYRFSEGFPKIQFTPVDTGDTDLHAYAHNGGDYLYAFPANGRTLWRIQFPGPGDERDAVIGPSSDDHVLNGIGPRFLELLVEKYGDQL